MDAGIIVEEGNPSQVINEPREERTKKFLANVLEN
jgi:polar amino acid transport system ATP-binding protein